MCMVQYVGGKFNGIFNCASTTRVIATQETARLRVHVLIVEDLLFSMSTEIAIKKHRRPNFTSEDLNVLADAVASNKAHLFGKFTNTITANSKSSIWGKISTQINAGNDTVRRTGEEVKRKWTDWSSTIKTKNAKRNVTRRMAGGGPAVPESTDIDLKVLAVIGKDATDHVRSRL